MMSQCEALSDTPLSDGSTVAASILRSITSWICSSGTWSVLTPGETPACSSLGGFTTDSSPCGNLTVTAAGYNGWLQIGAGMNIHPR
jgi:hypothetical protein